MKTRLLFLVPFLCLWVFAQEPSVPPEPQTSFLDNPLLPPDTSNPSATLFGFLEDINRAYELSTEQGRHNISAELGRAFQRRLLRYMDTTELPEHIREQAGLEAAISLKEILDRIPLPDPSEAPGGEDAPDRWKIPGTDLVIRKQTEGLYQDEYLFSARTVQEAAPYFETIQHMPYRTTGPQTSPGIMHWYKSTPAHPWMAAVVSSLPGFFRNEVAGQTIWQWVGLVVILVGGALLMHLVIRLGRMRAKAFLHVKISRYVLTLLFPIAAVLIPLGIKILLRRVLVLSGEVLVVTDFIVGLLLLIAVMRLVWAIGTRIQAVVLTHPRFQQDILDAQIIRLVGRVATVLAVILVFLEGGKRLGIPLSTLVAGAGISGFAVAMAAQDSLKNILGSVMLILDKPFEVGDRILAKGFDGIVKEIGLRSTKLELLTGHGATLPNEELARTEIENISRRPFIRRILDLRIPLDTPTQNVENAIKGIEDLLENHEGMPPDFPPRVYYFDIVEDAKLFRIIYWYEPPAYWDYLAFNQRINLGINRLFEAEGITMLTPTRVTTENGADPLPVD